MRNKPSWTEARGGLVLNKLSLNTGKAWPGSFADVGLFMWAFVYGLGA